MGGYAVRCSLNNVNRTQRTPVGGLRTAPSPSSRAPEHTTSPDFAGCRDILTLQFVNKIPPFTSQILALYHL